MTNIIEISNINKFFGSGDNKIHVLKDISLSIQKGDFISIIGQSGSGKSTLMNILGCLDTPTDGSYKINGEPVEKMSKNQLADLRCKTFGFIFQRYNLLSNLKALDNVTLPAVYRGIPRDIRNKIAENLLDDLELEDKHNNKPNELSGGQQQRVSIARALMNGGEVILADEPTGALDSKSGCRVMEVIKDLHKQGHTIILVTHDKNIANYANRIIEIKDGIILSDTSKKKKVYKLARKKLEIEKSKFDSLKDQFIESFKMSVQAIISHKMRSVLTMLGIIIGIASVVSVVALGRGSQEKIMKDISSMGTNTIDIMPGKSWGDMRSGKITTLNVSDANFLSSQNYIDSTTPNVSASGTLVYKNISVSGQLKGVGEQYFDVKGVEIKSGKLFNRTDVTNLSSVVVIDENTEKELFSNEDAVGKIIIFNKKPLEVIGVTKKQKTPGPGNDSLTLYVPYTTIMYKITGGDQISSITVKISNNVNAQVAEKNITQILTARHGSKDFFTRNTDTIKQTIQSTTNTMTILISSIALISLIVGGIGVMNIMLVSVTERTKEIGIRMAIGARQKLILEQFLIEAVLICLIGGFLGVVLSGIIGLLFNLLSDNFAMAFSSTSIILAIICSSFIGIVFGFVPAKNASNLNPIEALARD